ncbi:pentapeptide repeat-containing protein [Prochlorothrix hollandica]|uniref:pentapeptide repeat-containing protein n=1 Tax=Prochlorothrix hollandica TaxID=1223 RepID=UPI003342AC4D
MTPSASRRSRLTPAQASEILAAYRAGTRTFQNYDFRGQNFAQATLQGADFSGCWLQGCNFRGANLRGVNFSHVKTGIPRRSQWILGIVLLLVSAIALALIYGLGIGVYCGVELQLLGLSPWPVPLAPLGWVLGGSSLYFLICSFLGRGTEGLRGLGFGLVALGLLLWQQPVGLWGLGALVILGWGRSIQLLAQANPLAPLVLGGLGLGGATALIYSLKAFGSDPSQTLLPALVTTGVLVPLLALYGHWLTLQLQILTDWKPWITIAAAGGWAMVQVAAVATGLVVSGELLDTFPSMVTVAGGSFLGLLLGLSLGWRGLQAPDSAGLLGQWAMTWNLRWGTQFQGATLSHANFTGSSLWGVNWQGAVVDYVQWHRVRLLEWCDYGHTYLRYPQVRQLFLGKLSPHDRCFDGLDLRRIHLSNWPEKVNPLDLTGASFVGADLSQANLRQVNLTGAQLVGTNLVGTCLTGACLTGACIEQWRISADTQTDGVVCDYVELRRPTPTDRNPLRQPPQADQVLELEDRVALLRPSPLATLTQEFEQLLQCHDPVLREYYLLQRAEAAPTSQGLTPEHYRHLFHHYAQTQAHAPAAPGRGNGGIKGRSWLQAIGVWLGLGAVSPSSVGGNPGAWGDPDPGVGKSLVIPVGSQAVGLQAVGLQAVGLQGSEAVPPPWSKAGSTGSRTHTPNRRTATLVRWGIVALMLVLINTLLQSDETQRNQPWEIIRAEDSPIQGGSRVALEQLHRNGSDLSNLQAPEASLQNIQLPGAKLNQANFSQGQLDSADFSGAQLRRSNFESASLVNAKLGYSRLHGVGQGTIVATVETLVHPLLPPLWQRGADLQEARFKDANLTGADLREANLQGADLRNVIFTATLLQGADLSGTDLRSAYLNTTLDQVTFTNALYSYLTVFPAGFDPTAAAMVLEESLEGDPTPPTPPPGPGDSNI